MKNRQNGKKQSVQTFWLCITGVLCALAIAGRMALWVVPNVQPVTVLIIIISVYAGVYYGVCSAVTVSFLTNLLMGSLGMWTLYQGAAWAVVALLSSLFFKNKRDYTSLLIWSIAAAYIYGTAVDLCSWQVFSGSTGIGGFLTYKLAGLLFDTYHAIGNVIFISVFYPLLNKFLQKHYPGQGV